MKKKPTSPKSVSLKSKGTVNNHENWPGLHNLSNQAQTHMIIHVKTYFLYFPVLYYFCRWLLVHTSAKKNIILRNT